MLADVFRKCFNVFPLGRSGIFANSDRTLSTRSRLPSFIIS